MKNLIKLVLVVPVLLYLNSCSKDFINTVPAENYDLMELENVQINTLNNKEVKIEKINKQDFLDQLKKDGIDWLDEKDVFDKYNLVRPLNRSSNNDCRIENFARGFCDINDDGILNYFDYKYIRNFIDLNEISINANVVCGNYMDDVYPPGGHRYIAYTMYDVQLLSNMKYGIQGGCVDLIDAYVLSSVMFGLITCP